MAGDQWDETMATGPMAGAQRQMTPSEIAEAITMDGWEGTQFADASVRTGQPAWAGMMERQGGAVGSVPGRGATASSRWQSRTKHRAKTVRELIADLRKMGSTELAALQVKMVEAGLFTEKPPVLGVLTEETVSAFKNLLSEALIKPDKTYYDVLKDLADNGVLSRGSSIDQEGAKVVQLSDPTAIKDQALAYAEEELGMKLDDTQLSVLVGLVHNREKQNATASYNAAPGEAGDIDRFMNALSGVESGGDPNIQNGRTGAHGLFQIMPGNWRPWAQRAGLSPDAPKTPENQRIVARAIIGDYYKQFGNWRDVAIAWYAGPGRVAKLRNQDMQVQGGREPSVHEYANRVIGRMGNPTTNGAQGLTFNVDESVDLRKEVRNLDPTRAKAHDFADTMGDFFSLLGASE